MNAGERLHTERTFEFVAEAPMDTVAPLFGADMERVWAPDWNPNFVWPLPANDRMGMVFTLDRDGKAGVWVNTCFDLQRGRVQYVYVVPDTVVTVITLQLTARAARTHIAVAYQRTALDAGADDRVQQMAEGDGKAGSEWQRLINTYLTTLQNQ